MQPGAGPGGQPIPDAVGVTKTEPCATAEQSFAWELYGPVFSRCMGCHNEFGLAQKGNVRLKFVLPGEPEFAETNVELLREYATSSVMVEGAELALLVAKPTGKMGHVGGEVLKPDGPEARLLASFVEKLRTPPACAQTLEDKAQAALEALTLSSPRETYARAKLLLTGEVATPEEVDALPDTEAMLDEQLDALLASAGFLDRAQEMFGDWLRTDAYSSLVRGDELMQQLRDYPRNTFFQPLCSDTVMNRCCDPATEQCCANLNPDTSMCTEAAGDLAIDAVAREPLELIRHIVKNDLPLTEIVTASYTLLNPYSAAVYGLTDGQRAQLFDTDPNNDATEFKAVAVTPSALNNLRGGPDGLYPHSGVLTMPATLIRYPSSTSNQERTRGARVILERMLAIPVMKLADFSTAKLPADADLELATQEYPACTVCHSAIDPIAAHFRSFGAQSEYRPVGQVQGQGRPVGNGSSSTSHLPPASFLGVAAPPPTTGEPVRWLGEQVASNERFALGTLMPVLADLIGTEIMTPPTEVLDPDYAAKYLAYRMQQLEIQRLRREFAGPLGLRLPPLVKTIVRGRFFRASGAPELDPVMTQALALAGVGPGTLLTPEQLARKIESVTGVTYRSGRSPGGRDLFRSFRDYRLMFGGTDWDATPERYREPNAMAVRIALRMSNELACVAVPQDLSFKDVAARRLLPGVSVTTTPEAGGEGAIRAAIQRLHRLLLNETLAENDPEIEATYNLWRASYQALSGTSGGRPRGGGGGVRCNAAASFTTDAAAYPNDAHTAVDDVPSVRAWVAVLSYLFADGRFFLQ
jgi:hypothetical protein